MARIVPRTEREKARGDQLTQWLAGCAGAIFTTLPSFVVLPVWLLFCFNYKIVDADGRDDDFTCGVVCFLGGLAVWAIVILAAVISKGA